MRQSTPLCLQLLGYRLAICKLGRETEFPRRVHQSGFLAVVQTPDELSIVCEERFAPEAGESERGWRAFMVEGPLDFSLTGVLSGVATPLADSGISIFAISSYDTDYILVREQSVPAARAALQDAGYQVHDQEERV